MAETLLMTVMVVVPVYTVKQYVKSMLRKERKNV